jgi:hypothetical protein
MSLRKALSFRVILSVCGLLAMPLAFSANTGRVSINEASCSGGTCCPESGSTCYPNSCSNPLCADHNAWWRSDGKPCSAPILPEP